MLWDNVFIGFYKQGFCLFFDLERAELEPEVARERLRVRFQSITSVIAPAAERGQRDVDLLAALVVRPGANDLTTVDRRGDDHGGLLPDLLLLGSIRQNPALVLVRHQHRVVGGEQARRPSGKLDIT